MTTHPKTSMPGAVRGGRRPNGGRPKGALGKRSRELLEQAKVEGFEMPVASPDYARGLAGVAQAVDRA